MERQTTHFKTAIAALRANLNGNLADVTQDSMGTGVVPPIIDVCQYLADAKKQVAQAMLIYAVGALRKQRYPQLSNHYSNVWRAIEYHVRHDRLIQCVDEEGRPAELKPLPPRVKGRKLADSAELYEQDNWFQLKDQEALQFLRITASAERGTGPR